MNYTGKDLYLKSFNSVNGALNVLFLLQSGAAITIPVITIWLAITIYSALTKILYNKVCLL